MQAVETFELGLPEELWVNVEECITKDWKEITSASLRVPSCNQCVLNTWNYDIRVNNSDIYCRCGIGYVEFWRGFGSSKVSRVHFHLIRAITCNFRCLVSGRMTPGIMLVHVEIETQATSSLSNLN